MKSASSDKTAELKMPGRHVKTRLFVCLGYGQCFRNRYEIVNATKWGAAVNGTHCHAVVHLSSIHGPPFFVNRKKRTRFTFLGIKTAAKLYGHTTRYGYLEYKLA